MKTLNKDFKFLTRIEMLSKKTIFQIMQNTFMSFSGILLVSSLITLFIKFPGINWNSVFGEEFVLSVMKVSSIGFDYISLFVVITFTYYYLEYYNSKYQDQIRYIPVIILNIAIFLTITYSPVNVLKNTIDNTLNSTYLGSSGVFGALLISFVSVKIYAFFIRRKMYIKLPNEVPQIISDSFLSIIPMLMCVILSWMITFFLGIDVLGFTNQLFLPLIHIGNSVISVVVLPLLNRILWFVGIHGAAVINSFMSSVFVVLDASNLEAFVDNQPLPYLVTGNFFSIYVWIGLFPVSLALLSHKSKSLKSVGIAGLIPTLFNIDEPILFGLPIILNPILLIPFVLSALIPSFLSYFAVLFKLIPIPVLTVPWTVPAPIKAYLATNNDIRALLWVLFLWLLIYLIFLPFIKKLTKGSMEVSN